jgi:hypothetical protein
MTKILHLGHVDSAQVDKDKLRDDMIYYRDGPYLVFESTFREMIMRATYDTSWAGHPRICMSLRHHMRHGYFSAGCLNSKLFLHTLSGVRMAYFSVRVGNSRTN